MSIFVETDPDGFILFDEPEEASGLSDRFAREFRKRGFVDRYQQQQLIDWDEEKHPRDDDGKFTSGSGTPKKSEEQDPREEKKTERGPEQEAPPPATKPSTSWTEPKKPATRALELDNHFAVEGATSAEKVWQMTRLKKWLEKVS